MITRGTIEEKGYHWQIYKHFLTNKILRALQQRRFFKETDMQYLFTQQKENAATETTTLFAEVYGSIQLENEESKNVGKVCKTQEVIECREGQKIKTHKKRR